MRSSSVVEERRNNSGAVEVGLPGQFRRPELRLNACTLIGRPTSLASEESAHDSSWAERCPDRWLIARRAVIAVEGRRKRQNRKSKAGEFDNFRMRSHTRTS